MWETKLEGDYDDCEICLSDENESKHQISAINL